MILVFHGNRSTLNFWGIYVTYYRNRLQIIADVLAVAKDGARKTHIMYGANLSYSLLNQCIADVLGAGLVQLGKGGWYEITDKGRMFLDKYNEFFEGSKRIKEQVNGIEEKKVKLERLLSK
jgi:predicted transcriptional regulator